MKKYQIDMCSGSLVDKILLFTLPLIASSLLQLLFNAADVVVVGRFAGKEALAAVGSNTALIHLTVNLFIGLSVGANVVSAQGLGARRQDEVKSCVHTAISLALVSGIGLMVLGAALARQLLVWTSSPADVIELATIYLRIYFLGMPANLLYNFGAALLRSQGDTRRPLYYLTFAGVVNVALNLLFVIAFRMDVAGVALATIISQYISAALVLRCMLREEGAIRLELRCLRLERRTLLRILRVGLPAGVQGVLFALSNVVIQSSLNSFDNAVLVAGSAAASNLEGFVYVSMNAFHQTAMTFTSQNYGAGEYRRVDRVTLECVGFVALTGLVLGNLLYRLGQPLAAIYAPGEEEVIRQAMVRLRYVAVPYALCGVMDVMVGALRGIGCSVLPTVVSLMGACGFRLLWVATVFRFYRTPPALYVTYPLSWLLTGGAQLLFFLYMRRRAYRKTEDVDR